MQIRLTTLTFGIWFLFTHSVLASPLNPIEKMAFIPEGEFKMGTQDGNALELPIHSVQLNAFYLDRFEVSNTDYETFRQDHRRSRLSSCDTCPVTLVTWFEADAFCRDRGARLPTEAEWERAAKGPKMYPYSFGPEADILKGRFALAFDAGATRVDTLSPNEFGLNHMSGNVWEWIQDWFGPYPDQTLINPQGPDSGFQKSVRGGSWYNASYYIHTGMRFKFHPKSKLNSLGFRCAMDYKN